ncbi:MAG TPA: FAD:protein FMN transferase [Tepidisphaeraceae bacterium]|nr:FAD:protein FMN transferase [Tepidisphaeraceae bacterium]
MRSPPVSPPATRTEFAGATMGGPWSVKFPAAPPDATLERRVADELARLDGDLSLWRPESALSQFNRQTSTDWTPVPADVARAVAIAREISEMSGGAFDVTIAPAVDLWGFGPAASPAREGRPPADAEVAAAIARVDYRQLDVREDPPALRKRRPDVRIDLGAIGKGYAADRVAAILDQAGANDSLIAVGGELRARGRAADGRPWRVGVETPVPDVRRVLLAVELPSGTGLSTSGDYRNFLDVAGHRLSHEIDPRTARPIPAARGPALVSVIHESNARADAWATALFVLGPDEGYALAIKLNLAALFVTRGDGKFETRMTPGFEKCLAQ